MNNRKQKNKRGRNPRQIVVQAIKENREKKKDARTVIHLTQNQQ